MSLECPCIYYRGNGLCSYGGDLTDANICVFGPCDHDQQRKYTEHRTTWFGA